MLIFGRTIENMLVKIPTSLVVLFCLTIGLAPFNPPHIWEKARMLVNLEMVRPIDWFDFIFHGAPWLVLVLKAIQPVRK